MLATTSMRLDRSVEHQPCRWSVHEATGGSIGALAVSLWHCQSVTYEPATESGLWSASEHDLGLETVADIV